MNTEIQFKDVARFYLACNVRIVSSNRTLVHEHSVHKGEVYRLRPTIYQHVLTGSCHVEPFLHPLSDLTKEIEHNGKKFIPERELKYMSNEYIVPWERYGDVIRLISNEEYRISVQDITELPYWLVAELLEWHFDIYGLIKEGLAVDINTLEQ